MSVNQLFYYPLWRVFRMNRWNPLQCPNLLVFSPPGITATRSLLKKSLKQPWCHNAEQTEDRLHVQDCWTVQSQRFFYNTPTSLRLSFFHTHLSGKILEKSLEYTSAHTHKQQSMEVMGYNTVDAVLTVLAFVCAQVHKDRDQWKMVPMSYSLESYYLCVCCD